VCTTPPGAAYGTVFAFDATGNANSSGSSKTCSRNLRAWLPRLRALVARSRSRRMPVKSTPTPQSIPLPMPSEQEAATKPRPSRDQGASGLPQFLVKRSFATTREKDDDQDFSLQADVRAGDRSRDPVPNFEDSNGRRAPTPVTVSHGPVWFQSLLVWL